MHSVHHRTVSVDGLTVAYREAGDPDAPAVVLLHGFPASSQMFDGLIEDLAGGYRVLAPDHVGFGHSDAPPVTAFDYTFDRLAEITATFLDTVGADEYALYIQDYGAPIGLRIAAGEPARVLALIVQNGNAYEDGLTPFWKDLRQFWADRKTHLPGVLDQLRQDDFRWQYLHGVPADRLDLVNPDSWVLDRARLDRPGAVELNAELFWDYRTNLTVYPVFHEYFRAYRPPTLIAWGANDEIFGADGARAYRRDLPEAELHLLDAGHFALATHRAEIAGLIQEFLPRALARRAG